MSTTTISKKPLTLYSVQSANGFQVSILLEELKAINAALDYNVEKIEFPAPKALKEPWFLKLNPNSTVPTLVDHSRGDFPVFETSAILLYLAQRYDKDHVFWFNPQTEADDYSTMLQWIFFSHGGLAPMSAQAIYFKLIAPEKIPYAQERYLAETKRLYGVLEIRLQDRDWLAGSGRGKYSLADMKSFPMVNIHGKVGIESLDEWPNVKAWIARNLARTAVVAGLNIPA